MLSLLASCWPLLFQKPKKPKAAETIVKSDVVEDSPGPSNANTGKDATNINSGEKRNIAFCKGTAVEGSTLPASGKDGQNASGPLKRPATSKEEKSEAYKSIFTSHSSAKRSKEQSSNWITHTAYYF
ncbi:UNVERIFIED_CONTAM: hypothetical protein K2H54_067894 [Gekko kuhli]